MNLATLETEVLRLDPVERSHLLERLVASLDVDLEIEQAWEQEANRREAELASGAVSVMPATEAIARLKARIVR